MAIIQATEVSSAGAGVHQQQPHHWSAAEKFWFRVFLIFNIQLIVPLSADWYGKLFASKTVFQVLNGLTGYRPSFYTISNESGRWGLASYITWLIALGVALAGAGIWTFIVRNRRIVNYDKAYYWIRVAIRYRIAIGIIAFGFLKLYPMQMPDPSISNLDTNFGDYNTYKIYWQIVGVSIWYEIVLGLVEIVAGLLLFFRGTAALGAVLVGGVLYNIAHANLAYDGGVHVYSSFFVLLSAFLLIPYIPYLWKLLIKKEDVTPRHYYPPLRTRKQRTAFYTTKYAFVLIFTVIFAYLRYDVHYHVGQLKEPITKGLPNAAGLYNVTEFRLNGKVLPYSPLDSVRWQSVVLEKWSTLIYKVNKAFPISLANGTPTPKDIDRSYELAGIAGGRRFFYYTINNKNNTLVLQDKNRPSTEDGDGSGKKKDIPEPPKLVWKFSRPSDSRIVISGLNDQKDSIYVVLDRIPKQYLSRTDRSEL